MCALWTKRDAKPSMQQLKAKRMERILSDALDQRSKINLTLEKGLTNLKTISAALVTCGKAELTLEVASLKSASPSWVGSRLSCYFRIRDREQKNRTVFLNFDARIASIRTSPGGLVLFVVERPDEVHEAQQRRCVRVEVDERRISALELWPELPAKSVPAGLPPLATSTNSPESDLRVTNISTTGLRLVVKNAAMKALFPDLRKGHCVTLRFQAMIQEEETPGEFLVNAVLRNGFNDLEKKETALGFEFSAEGSLDEQARLKWEPLRSGEVSALGPFVVKWNLLDFHSENRVE